MDASEPRDQPAGQGTSWWRVRTRQRRAGILGAGGGGGEKEGWGRASGHDAAPAASRSQQKDAMRRIRGRSKSAAAVICLRLALALAHVSGECVLCCLVCCPVRVHREARASRKWGKAESAARERYGPQLPWETAAAARWADATGVRRGEYEQGRAKRGSVKWRGACYIIWDIQQHGGTLMSVCGCPQRVEFNDRCACVSSARLYRSAAFFHSPRAVVRTLI
jgi:hypothetical protein